MKQVTDIQKAYFVFFFKNVYKLLVGKTRWRCFQGEEADQWLHMNSRDKILNTAHRSKAHYVRSSVRDPW